MTTTTSARKGRSGSPTRLWWVVYAWLIAVIQFRPVAAWADSISGPLSPLDTMDSHGVELSRFQLSTPDPWLDPAKSTLINVLGFMWDMYRWGMGITAYVLDWTTGMGWVDAIIGPINSASVNLRTTLLGPVGGTSLQGGLIGVLILVAGAVAAMQYFRGQRGRSGAGIIQALVAACLTVGLFAAPVALFANTDAEGPLGTARNAGTQLAHAAVSGELDPEAEPTRMSTILIDTFVRPVHQAINYGDVIDTANPECAKVYDQALKDAQSSKELSKIHEALRGQDCPDQYKQHAENPSMSWLVPLLVFGGIANFLGILLLAFILFMWLAVVMLAWSSLKLMFTTMRAILPGGSLMAPLRDLIGVATSLIYVVVSMVMLGVVMSAIRATMGNEDIPLILRFIGAVVIIVAGAVLLTLVFVQHIRGRKTALQWLQDKLRQRPIKPSLASKAMKWATSSATTPGGKPGAAGKGGASGKGGVGGLLSRAANTNVGRLAMTAAKVGGTVATGGSALAVTAATTAKGRLARTALKVGRTAYRAKQNYQAGRSGVAATLRGPRTKIPILGQLGDTAALAAGRAHTHLATAARVARAGWTGSAFDDTDAQDQVAPSTGNTKLDAHLLHLGHRLKHSVAHPLGNYTPPGKEVTETLTPGTTQTRRGNTTERTVTASAYQHHLRAAQANARTAKEQRERDGQPEPVTAATYFRSLRASDRMRSEVARTLRNRDRAAKKDDRSTARSRRRTRLTQLLADGHDESLVHHPTPPKKGTTS